MLRKFSIALAFAVLAPGFAQAAQLVVVEARGVGFSPGATVDSTKPITLKEGQHLTLISPAGVTIKLDGPYNAAPDSAQGKGTDLSTKLAALTAGGQRFGEVGTTRGTRVVKLPSPWVMDVSRSGSVCLNQGGEAVLWHPASTGKYDVTITPDDQSWRAVVEWPAGRDSLEVAPAVPLHTGGTYYVTINGERAVIIIESVPSALATDKMRAAWMAEKGCEAQAEAMLRTAQ